jgi:hypothetical protein
LLRDGQQALHAICIPVLLCSWIFPQSPQSEVQIEVDLMLSVAARVDDEPLGPVEVERQVGGRSSGDKRDDEEQRDERERAAARRPDLQIIRHFEHPREQIECPHATDRRSHPVVAVRHVCFWHESAIHAHGNLALHEHPGRCVNDGVAAHIHTNGTVKKEKAQGRGIRAKHDVSGIFQTH